MGAVKRQFTDYQIDRDSKRRATAAEMAARAVALREEIKHLLRADVAEMVNNFFPDLLGVRRPTKKRNIAVSYLDDLLTTFDARCCVFIHAAELAAEARCPRSARENDTDFGLPRRGNKKTHMKREPKI